eukprot:TRINITY_DN1057_c0_g1_i2.p1 TRINITY_DN1057_c0_g1~~TRINITY_DN1057_c0_g1_i2.p1  ORF type:complete len:197 (-),score=23.64 TRINITY_DN1057_c0_g1_i2:53-643(-)
MVESLNFLRQNCKTKYQRSKEFLKLGLDEKSVDSCVFWLYMKLGMSSLKNQSFIRLGSDLELQLGKQVFSAIPNFTWFKRDIVALTHEDKYVSDTSVGEIQAILQGVAATQTNWIRQGKPMDKDQSVFIVRWNKGLMNTLRLSCPPQYLQDLFKGNPLQGRPSLKELDMIINWAYPQERRTGLEVLMALKSAIWQL